MFSVSGPGSWQPSHGITRTQATQGKAQRDITELPPPSRVDDNRPLIHPATGSEFRRPLQALLSGLPQALPRGLVRQGYTLHVIDGSGLHDLTLDFPDLDPVALWSSPGVAGWLEEPGEWTQLAADHGACSPEEVSEWSALARQLNPQLARPEGELLLPDLAYWHGRRLPAEGRRFLLEPHIVLDDASKAGKLAAMVTHGPLPGLPADERRILFWDRTFRGGDGLTDWYVLHELGHATEYSLAFAHPDAWHAVCDELEQAWDQACAEGRLITSYAGEEPHEYFAESFAAWCRTRPGSTNSPEALPQQRALADRERLQALDPWAAELVQEVVGLVCSL